MSLKIKSFGTEGISNLSILDKLEVLASKCPLTTLLLKTNYNPNDESCHNIYDKNMNSDKCKIYVEGKWIEVNAEEATKVLLVAKRKDIHNIYCQLKPYLKDITIRLIEDYQKNWLGSIPIRTENSIATSILKDGISIEDVEKDMK